MADRASILTTPAPTGRKIKVRTAPEDPALATVTFRNYGALPNRSTVDREETRMCCDDWQREKPAMKRMIIAVSLIGAIDDSQA
jgi:hypothetical protein